MSHNDYLCEEDQAEGAVDDAPLWGCGCTEGEPLRIGPEAPTCPHCGCEMVEVAEHGNRLEISPLGAGM